MCECLYENAYFLFVCEALIRALFRPPHTHTICRFGLGLGSGTAAPTLSGPSDLFDPNVTQMSDIFTQRAYLRRSRQRDCLVSDDRPFCTHGTTAVRYATYISRYACHVPRSVVTSHSQASCHVSMVRSRRVRSRSYLARISRDEA